MSHLVGPWLAISPTMGAAARRRGQHHSPPPGRHRPASPRKRLIKSALWQPHRPTPATAAADLPLTTAEAPRRRPLSTEQDRRRGGGGATDHLIVAARPMDGGMSTHLAEELHYVTTIGRETPRCRHPRGSSRLCRGGILRWRRSEGRSREGMAAARV
jgi:hypothetical protein